MTLSGEAKGLLRFLTAGSVDDGKSTLIGRLLYDSNGVYDDQLDSVRKASAAKSVEVDLSLITDGLKAEREQAITIDVAYRYFSTPKRNFIIADTPGHVQYTRNMVTGASTADLAVLLVDARKGLLEQTKRHAYIVWLLGIRRVIVAVNKMDLVGYDQQVFTTIQQAFGESTAFMEGMRTYFVPLSALTGENVVRRAENIPWYSGPSLLELLETIPIEQDLNLEDFRFPVQSVIRPNQDFRGYAGQIVSGIVRAGQEVVALPSGQRTKVEQVMLYQNELDEAVPPQSVLLTLTNHVDLGRGDMLVDPQKMPIVSNRLYARMIWMSQQPLKVGVPYLIKHATQVLCCSVVDTLDRLEVESFGTSEADTLQLNEIGTVEIETHKPMFFDPYSMNRAMGNFIMIDPGNNDTVAAGIVLEKAAVTQPSAYADLNFQMTRSESTGLTVWFTGLSGAGKSTISNEVHTELLAQGFRVEMLDGDAIRKHLNSDLGFSARDREENIRRIGYVSQLLSRHGVVVLVAAISPYRAMREELRRNITNFLEVYVNAPLTVCEERDPKGLYKRARQKQIARFTGIDDPYEPPLDPEVECRTDQESVKASASKVVSAVMAFFASRLQGQQISAESQADVRSDPRCNLTWNGGAQFHVNSRS